MRHEDFEEFAFCWRQACEGAGKKAATQAIEWAFEVLADMTLEQVRFGLIAHARCPESGQFVPKAADIIRHIVGKKADRKEAGTVAWARVLENVNRYNSFVFDDPAIHYAIAVGFGGNWDDVCNFDENDFACQEKRRSFVTAYAGFKQGMNYPPRLVGWHEMEGCDFNECLTVVGDKKAARLVHQGGNHQGLEAVATSLPNMAALGVAA